MVILGALGELAWNDPAVFAYYAISVNLFIAASSSLSDSKCFNSGICFHYSVRILIFKNHCQLTIQYASSWQVLGLFVAGMVTGGEYIESSRATQNNLGGSFHFRKVL